MRKLTGVFILNFVLFSCTTEYEFVNQETSTAIPKLAKRSLTEALEIAQDATSLFGAESRSEELRRIDMDNIQYVCSVGKSRSQVDDTLLYVVNYADNSGFAVVSANPGTAGLLAVTEAGNYNPASDDISSNNGMRLFMNMAESYVSDFDIDINSVGPVPMLEVMERVDTTDTYVLPKLTTKWGQVGCESTYAPNFLAGCMNTALAQIMTYFEYPSQIDITYEGAQISQLNLNWSEIKKYKGIYYNNTASNSTLDCIGHLLRQLGKLTNTSYSEFGTYTRSDSALIVMSDLGYNVSSDIISYNDNVNFHSALNNNNLILMCGKPSSTARSISKGAHAWIVDGHLQRELHYTVYTRPSNSELWQLRDQYFIYYNYNHINWGDDGCCNGYFLEDVFNKSCAYQYDDSNNDLIGNYTENLQYFLVTR